jgi:conjugative relaxase-like TrwC/TraI family protein
MLSCTNLKIAAGGGGGKGGNSRGSSAASILNYAEDRRAADYYGQQGQAPALAMGSGWESLGLQPGERPTREQMANLLNGYGPNGEELARIRANQKNEIRAGIDLTFSAPKSFSAAWALSDVEHKAELDEAHAKAMAAAIGWIEENGYVTLRSGLNGTNREPAHKLSVMTYMHDTSRADDPQKHGHAILLNIAQTESGEWRRIDAAEVFRHKIEIGAVYRAELARQLVEMGYSIERDKTSFKIKDSPSALEKAWSKGGAAIAEQLGEWGTSGGKAAQAAAYATRDDKSHASADELKARWSAEISELGISDKDVAALRKPDDQVTFAKYSEQEVIADLSSNSATFSDRDLRKAVAIAMNAGGGGVDEIREAMDKIKTNSELIELVDANGVTRWTTKEMRRVETELVANVEARRGKAKPLSDETIKWAIAEAERIKGFGFSDEQKAAIEHVMGSKNADKFLEGVAGAGKSTLALAVRLGYEKEGRKVYGMALASKAATGLADGTGIQTSTIDSFLYRVEKGHITPPAGSIVLIDEANMSDTRQIARVVKVSKERGFEVAFIGDRSQLQAIQAGSAFAYLYDQAANDEKAAITTSSRQKGQHAEAWKGFVHGIRSGENKEIFKFLDGLGNLKISEEGEEIHQAVQAWSKNRETGLADAENIFVTNRNDMKQRLNDAAREISGQAARVDNVEIQTTNRAGESTGKREFAPGDRVITLKNEKKLGIDNGALWTVEAVKKYKGEETVTLRSDAGKRVCFSTAEYNALDHGYALTVHQAEGVTSTGVVGMPSDMSMMDLHSWYVMMSRSRNAENTHLVIPSHVLDEAEEVHATASEDEQPAENYERLDSLLKAVARERYDHLSLSFQTKEQNKVEAAGAGQANPRAEERADQNKQDAKEQQRSEEVEEVEEVQETLPPVETDAEGQQKLQPVQTVRTKKSHRRRR